MTVHSLCIACTGPCLTDIIINIIVVQGRLLTNIHDPVQVQRYCRDAHKLHLCVAKAAKVQMKALVKPPSR